MTIFCGDIFPYAFQMGSQRKSPGNLWRVFDLRPRKCPCHFWVAAPWCTDTRGWSHAWAKLIFLEHVFQIYCDITHDGSVFLCHFFSGNMATINKNPSFVSINLPSTWIQWVGTNKLYSDRSMYFTDALRGNPPTRRYFLSRYPFQQGGKVIHPYFNKGFHSFVPFLWVVLVWVSIMYT